jgi:hypothetical protein
MTDFDRQSLHEFLTRRYDLEGLKTLCLYLEVDHDNLDGRTKDSLARELIRYMERVERVGELVTMQAQAEAALARRDVPPERLYKITHDPRRVFISHAHQDAAFAHRLAADLERAGIPVWIAPESIRPGEQWLPAIARGLQESGVCAVVLTPDGVASSWVEYETNLAISRERRGQMRLLLLDVAECEPPFGWTGYQFLPFRGEYAAGLAALRARLAGEQGSKGAGEQGGRGAEEQQSEERAKPMPAKSGLPTRTTSPTERRVKEEQWRQLQALAHEIAAELGRQSGDDETREVYRRFNRHFGLTTYKKLPRRRFAEGLAFFTEWRGEVMAAATSRIHEKTGIELIRIPAGPFLYGGEKRKIELPEFWIGRHPVTNAEYKHFVDATDRNAPRHWNGKSPPQAPIRVSLRSVAGKQ